MFRRSFLFLAAVGVGPFDPWKILGLKPGASNKEVKQAYHRLALRFHPDGGPEGNAERFNAVHEAYAAVKDGKWTPTAEQQKSTMKEGQGYDPKYRRYVYEQPGSTTENYVNSHTQTLLRIAMLWCFFFVMARFFLLFVFPNTSSAIDIVPEIPLQGGSPQSTAVPPNAPESVHEDDEHEADWSMTAQANLGVSGASYRDHYSAPADPLARRS